MKLSTGLVLSFSAVLALMAVTSVPDIVAMRAINTNVRDIPVNLLPSVKVAGATLRDVRRFELAEFVSATEAGRQTARKRIGDTLEPSRRPAPLTRS